MGANAYACKRKFYINPQMFLNACENVNIIIFKFCRSLQSHRWIQRIVTKFVQHEVSIGSIIHFPFY